MGGLLESLMGGGSSYSTIGSGYSGDGLESLLGGYFGGGSSSGSTGSILDLLTGRSITAEKAAECDADPAFYSDFAARRAADLGADAE